MMRGATLAILLAAISGCGMSKGQSPNDQAAEMIEWMQRNPPVSQATWRGVAKLECRPQCKSFDTNSVARRYFVRHST